MSSLQCGIEIAQGEADGDGSWLAAARARPAKKGQDRGDGLAHVAGMAGDYLSPTMYCAYRPSGRLCARNGSFPNWELRGLCGKAPVILVAPGGGLCVKSQAVPLKNEPVSYH